MKHCAVLLLFIVACACKQPEHAPPAISFYYWRTTFALSTAEHKALQHYGVTRLYVRYFDVALRHGQAVPVSPVAFQQAPPAQVDVVPVVYIRNEVMLDAALDADALAQKIMAYTHQIDSARSRTTHEIQIDCDWTLASRDAYFHFLKTLRGHSGRPVSVTVRLHQVKYFAKTGVPPADRRVLMYYNMGHIDAEVTSSVYDRATAQSYLTSAPAYPRQLDVALPVFSWGIQLRGGRVVALLNKTDEATFAADPHFKQQTKPFFEVTENVLKIGKYFKRGDLVKVESISASALLEMAHDLSAKLPFPPTEIIFYDLDEFNLNHYHHEEDILEDVRRAF